MVEPPFPFAPYPPQPRLLDVTDPGCVTYVVRPRGFEPLTYSSGG